MTALGGTTTATALLTTTVSDFFRLQRLVRYARTTAHQINGNVFGSDIGGVVGGLRSIRHRQVHKLSAVLAAAVKSYSRYDTSRWVHTCGGIV